MSYLTDRIYNGLGLRPDDCTARLRTAGGTMADVPIFSEDRDGNLRIILYGLDRRIVEVENDERHRQEDAGGDTHGRTAYLTRLRPEYLADHPDAPKYRMVPGEKTRPFFPPALLDKYEAGTFIPTLFLTEGFIKAFAAARLAGFDIVGLQSVTCYADKQTGRLHADILRLIDRCGVKNVVMVYDGDCLDISDNDLARGEELTRRPSMFVNSALAIKNLLSGLDGVDFWFMHQHRPSPADPKGLDDLVVSADPADRPGILADAKALGSVGKTGDGRFFYRLNLTTNANRLRAHFALSSAEEFYKRWADKIGGKAFVFFGSKYRIDDTGQKLVLELPGDLLQYYRIGTGYFRLLPYTDIWTGERRERLVPWQKGCILDDFKTRVKNPCDKIRKLDGFTFWPDNENYTRIRENLWNYYDAIRFDPEQGDCHTIKNFVRHIFGEQYELGLDYLQLLYQRPKQQLPILCLVSRERQTGKTTFCNFLADLFGENCAIVGNNAFTSQFNGFMAGKILVCCDETKLADRSDTVEITEKIKRMATERYTMIEYKGQDAIKLPNFAKFILCSNNEQNFIYTDREEVRFWVRRVGHLDSVDTRLVERMHGEIPAFLFYLNNRRLSTEEKTRAWFDFDLLKTDALKDLQAEQEPTVIKEIKEWVGEMFQQTGEASLSYSLSDLQEYVPYLRASKVPQSRVRRLLRDNMDKTPQRGRYTFFYLQPDVGGPTVQRISKQGSFYEFKADEFKDK